MIQWLPKDIPFAKVEEKDLEYWKQSYKDMFKRACEYKNEITDLQEENKKLKKFKDRVVESRNFYSKLWNNKHRMNCMRKDKWTYLCYGDYASLYSTTEYSNWEQHPMFIRTEEELVQYVKEIIRERKTKGACSLYIRHEWEEPIYNDYNIEK